jgi:asparagine synthetase B (glutamine-hydrolysing)
MCSIIVSTKPITDLDLCNKFTKLRGPDQTNHVKIGRFNYVHNLLSITGKFTTQPFVKNNKVCIYNGEIYNHTEFGKDYQSDGECLIDAYEQYGSNFPQKLDGEFAIFLYDEIKNIIIFSTDTFRTKPLFYSIENGDIGVATYEHPLKVLDFKKIHKAKPNTIYRFDLNNCTMSEETLVQFDCRQHKKHFWDWKSAFELSIAKRTKNLDKKMFIGLSSGYDSGAICCELLRQNTPFKSYLVVGTENQSVHQARLDLLMQRNLPYEILYKSDSRMTQTTEFVKSNLDDFRWTISSSSSSYNEFNTDVKEEGGSHKFAFICDSAAKDGYKVILSGQGPDEIYSDYGFQGRKIYEHSNFGGLFPENLSEIFPWNSFFGSSMESYIAKEEYVGGAYGIEVRYPFLDKNVVQEFLWLDHTLKNADYKSPIKFYFDTVKYPYAVEKRGF